MTAFAPGSVVLGRYRIAHSLGAGGMGVVYLAEHVSNGSKVVIKTVKDHLARDPEMRARFLREAEATRALEHPHIVDVIEASADPLLLVLEHLPGQSLQARLRQGPLPEADVISIALQLLDALDAAHRAKLIHRDIKPANVMVLEGNRVKLLDFGLSRVVDAARHTKLTQTGQILGTPGYLAPEQALARPVDARTDLYSLGVLMYRALAGRSPFEGNAAALLRAVVQDEPHPLPRLRPNVDPGLASVVHRALQKDPTFRFQTAREMRDALAPKKKTRWMLVATIAGVATAALTIGALAMMQSSEPTQPLAVRPVEPIVFDAHPSSPDAEPPAEAEAEPEAEPEAGEPDPTVVTRMRAPARAASAEPARRSAFHATFPTADRAALRFWWRQHEAMLINCFSGVPGGTRTWSVAFGPRGEVQSLAAGGANYFVTRCALNAVERASTPVQLHGRRIDFDVRWDPG